MKKLLTIAAAAACGAALAAVESPNIVGYVTYDLTAGEQDIRGVPFLSTGSSTFSIQGITLSNGSDGGDTIMFWDPATSEWETILHWNEAYETLESEDSIGEGWGDGEGTLVNKLVTPGTAFWIKTLNNTTVTIPGQVVEATDNTITTSATTQDLVAGVFPTQLNIQDISLGANGSDGGDTIMIWDPTTGGWETILHWNEAYETLESEDSIGEGWGDGEGTIIAKTLDPAQGFWIKTLNNCTVTFKSPL